MHATPHLMIAFGLALCSGLQAQVTTESREAGKVRYLATHNFAKKMAALAYISPQRRERVQYTFGNKGDWKVYTELVFNQTHSLYFDSAEKTDEDVSGYAWKKEAYFIRHDYEERTQSNLIHLLGKNYLVSDSLRCPEWKIMNDIKEVAGYLCMRASCFDTLKQQHITVWFALDIPSSAGPDRLCGLPGLILEADVNQGALTLTADRLTFGPQAAELLALPAKPKGKALSETAYRAQMYAYIQLKKKEEDPWFWGMRY
jgi:GLPGLI family protein